MSALSQKSALSMYRTCTMAALGTSCKYKHTTLESAELKLNHFFVFFFKLFRNIGEIFRLFTNFLIYFRNSRLYPNFPNL